MACSILLLAGCVAEHGPQLGSAAPPAAGRGAIVTLVGSDLCAGDCSTAAGEVLLGLGAQQLRAPIVSYADAVAVIAIPQLAPVGATEIVLSVGAASSNALAFEVLP